MNVYEKLLHVQQKLKAPKNQYNKFGDFHYRSCEDIQEAVKPLLQETKTVLLVNDEVVLIGSRFYIKATAVFHDTESTESITNTAFARENESKPKMDEAQITGSCSSYARKYALNGLFCIDDAKDPDTPPAENTAESRQDKKTTNEPKRTQNKKPAATQKVNSAELARLKLEADRTGTSLLKVCQRYNVISIEELTTEQYQRAMSAFSKMQTVQKQEDHQMDFAEYESEMPFR